MLATLPYLNERNFPAVQRESLTTLQVNMGYLCNLQCKHCHVNAGPKRKEVMSSETVDQIIDYIREGGVQTLDLTGGAPELNPDFRRLVDAARESSLQVIDRCNLTILLEPGQEDLASYLAESGVEIVASMPCYLAENVDSQRGSGTYDNSIEALGLLNELGYGSENQQLPLHLVYNPQGATLPPPQEGLEQDYKRHLRENHGIHFNQLLTIANMPIHRFGSMLISTGEFDSYMKLLISSFQADNLQGLMCRTLISIDWRGYLFDCDFNQMLDLPIEDEEGKAVHISQLNELPLSGRPIEVRDHCYGCTAGQGSGCGGAIK